MDKESTRNMIIFVVLTMLIMGLYQNFVMGPQLQRQRAAQAAAAAASAAAHRAETGGLNANATTTFGGHAGAVVTAPRVKIDTPSLVGALSLHGARIDDLALKHYHQSTDPNSPRRRSAWLVHPGGLAARLGARGLAE
jgi:YidC/Oxa1 family membrane protein insertase